PGERNSSLHLRSSRTNGEGTEHPLRCRMFSGAQHLKAFACVGLVLLGLPLSSVQAQQAPMLVLRNETQMGLIVQVSSVFAGSVRRARPILLNPRGTSQPVILPGDKVIEIYDASVPSRTLFKGSVPPSTQNHAYAIQSDTAPPRLRLQPIPFPPGGP